MTYIMDNRYTDGGGGSSIPYHLSVLDKDIETIKSVVERLNTSVMDDDGNNVLKLKAKAQRTLKFLEDKRKAIADKLADGSGYYGAFYNNNYYHYSRFKRDIR